VLKLQADLLDKAIVVAMAKNLILNALVDNLGTYVEDLKKEHLKLSLSTGQPLVIGSTMYYYTPTVALQVEMHSFVSDLDH